MEPFFHLIIPIIALLAFFPKLQKKYVLGLFFLTFLPDFDIFIPGYHRILFGNIFFLAIIASLVYIITKEKEALGISLFYLGSHLLMDLNHAGTALLWPIYPKLIALEAGITNTLGSWDLTLRFFTSDLAIAKRSYTHEYLSTDGTLIILLILILFIYKIVKEKHYKKLPFLHNK